MTLAPASPDLVNHPPHYTSHSGGEVIELTRRLPFGPGNAIKYVLRRDLKGNPEQDLEKAAWYLQDSADNGITYQITPEIHQIALGFIAEEPNRRVRVILDTLALTPGAVGRTGLLHALVHVNILRQDYKFGRIE